MEVAQPKVAGPADNATELISAVRMIRHQWQSLALTNLAAPIRVSSHLLPESTLLWSPSSASATRSFPFPLSNTTAPSEIVAAPLRFDMDGSAVLTDGTSSRWVDIGQSVYPRHGRKHTEKPRPRDISKAGPVAGDSVTVAGRRCRSDSGPSPERPWTTGCGYAW